MKIRIYVEGGGDTQRLRSACRRGFRELFRKADFEGRLPQVIACGSRGDAYEDFCTAWRLLQKSKSGDVALLLVDSEGPVAAGDGPWDHLKKAPPGVKDETCHLMVQCMESWFLADRDALKNYFGQGFSEGALPARRGVEEIPKADVLKGLKNATRHVKIRGRYDKGSHSFEILAIVDPRRIRAVAPHADRLFETLSNLV